MAMVVVDACCLKQADSQPKSCGLVWGSAAAWRCFTFTRWTEWILGYMTLPGRQFLDRHSNPNPDPNPIPNPVQELTVQEVSCNWRSRNWRDTGQDDSTINVLVFIIIILTVTMPDVSTTGNDSEKVASMALHLQQLTTPAVRWRSG